MALPMYMLLLSKSNNRYMTYIHKDGAHRGFLQFSGADVASPYAKFEIQAAKTKPPAYVHIRCRYNNRYLVRKSEQDTSIVADAKDPEEDEAKWCCTLFKPTISDSKAATVDEPDCHRGPVTTAVRFTHVQLDQTLHRNKADNDFLYAGKDNDDLVMVNCESLVIMPRHVTFNDGNRYLTANGGRRELQFLTNSTDLGSRELAYEVLTNVDGSVRIKSDLIGKYWKADAGDEKEKSGEEDKHWLVGADADEKTSVENKHCWFWPVKVDSNAVALRCVGNGMFCFSNAEDNDLKNVLEAGACSLSVETRILVGAPVVSRKIYNVNFRLDDARVYKETIVSKASGMVCNASDAANNATVKLSYAETKSSTWTQSHSVTDGVKGAFEAEVPLVFETSLELSGEFAGSYEWGQTVGETREVDAAYDVEMPEKSNVAVGIMATKGFCDVPFSYTQHDTMYDGKEVVAVMDDGVYHGMNIYCVQFESKQDRIQ